MKEKEKVWLKAGYEAFAYQGPEGLKIEQIARQTGISKSSFYHFFADRDFYMEKLLQEHLKNATIIAEKERNTATINPGLIRILTTHKTDLLFNRQLRINAGNLQYRQVLEQSNAIIGKDFIKLWLADTQQRITMAEAEAVFELALENFFLQINPENIHDTWLIGYFENLKRITNTFSNRLYGSV